MNLGRWQFQAMGLIDEVSNVFDRCETGKEGKEYMYMGQDILVAYPT